MNLRILQYSFIVLGIIGLAMLGIFGDQILQDSDRIHWFNFLTYFGSIGILVGALVVKAVRMSKEPIYGFQHPCDFY